MRIAVNKRDTVWSYIGTAVSLLINVIILPFVLIYLDDNSVGLYYVFTSVSSIVTLVDFGFSPSFARSIAYAWSGAKSLVSFGSETNVQQEPNYDLMCDVVTSCRYIYTALSLFTLMVTGSLGTFYIRSITANFSGALHMMAWYVYVIAIVINVLFGYYAVLLRGIGAIEKVNKATVIARVIQIFICIIAMMCGIGLLGVAIAYLVYGYVFRVLAIRWFNNTTRLDQRKKEKAGGKIYDQLDGVKEAIKAIWPNAWRDGLVTVSNFVLTQASTIISSIYLTLYETGVYSLCVQLVAAVATIACTLNTTYQPSLQSASVNKDVERQKSYISIIVLSMIALFTIGMIALLTIGRPIITFLKPSYGMSVPVLLLAGFYQLVLAYRNCYCSYLSTTNRLIYTKSFVISAGVCIALSYLFTGIFRLGIYGLIFAQICSQLMFNAWYWPVFVHRELGIPASYVVKKGISELTGLLFSRK